MNARKLSELNIPQDCIKVAISAIQEVAVASKKSGERVNVKKLIPKIVESPEDFCDDEIWGKLAKVLIEDRQFVRADPISYEVFGKENIESESFSQMEKCCELPSASHAALMPDAHAGYGLPIGGVLALENAVCPYAVGVDIACRMKLSVLDYPLPKKDLWEDDRFDRALFEGTRFGMGSMHDVRQDHHVMDRDWNVTPVTKRVKDKAWDQLGSSGGGNHFVEFGVLEIGEEFAGIFNLSPGKYVSLMSHSGSRGAGMAVCDHYSAIAQGNVPAKYGDLAQARLGWLDLDTEVGLEYWEAMNLMGDYASANHDVIHKLVSKLLGANPIAQVENHHNFAWIEEHYGKELVVHRKGATPASDGELGIIPGSMATPAFVVKGKGNAKSLRSASHGAGRRMSRKKAKDTYNFNAVKNDLMNKGVRVLRAGADEVPGVYKDIMDVMSAQTDLVDILASFYPKVVMMAGEEGKKSWQKNKHGNDVDW